MSETTAQLGGIVIRQARHADVAAIAALIMLGAHTPTMTREEVMAEAEHPDYAQAFEAVLASPDNTLFVVECAGEIVGTFQVTLIPGLVSRGRKRAKFESVHVSPECRGLGVGAQMVAFGLAFAEGQGAGLVELTSNKSRTDAHRFYRRLGFEQSHEGFKKLL